MKNKDVLVGEEFISYVFERDETSVVLKSHLYLEQVINKVIIKFAKNPEEFLKESFYKKIIFLYSIGVISKDFFDRISVINNIRNKFSHNFKYKLSSEEKSLLSKLIGPRVNIPKKLIKFYRSEESLLFSTIVANLILILRLILKIDKDLSRDILLESIERVSSKNRNRDGSARQLKTVRISP